MSLEWTVKTPNQPLKQSFTTQAPYSLLHLCLTAMNGPAAPIREPPLLPSVQVPGTVPVYSPVPVAPVAPIALAPSWRWPAPSQPAQPASLVVNGQAPRQSMAFLTEPVAGIAVPANWGQPCQPCQPCPFPPSSLAPGAAATGPPLQPRLGRHSHSPSLAAASAIPADVFGAKPKGMDATPEGVDTEAAILDLKEQIGGLRKELHTVRSNLDTQLRKEQPELGTLRQRVNSLCSELADCGTEALKMCSDLGHRGAGDAVLRSRSAPGGHVWRLPQPRNPAIRLSTGPAMYSCFPTTLSPRMVRSPASNAAEPITGGIARRSSGRTDASNLPSRAQSAGSAVNVMTANTSAQSLPRNESTGSFVLAAKPQMQVRTLAPSPARANAPLSPKETVPAKPCRARSPNPLPGSLSQDVLRQASAKSANSEGSTCHNCGSLAGQMV